MIKPIQRFNLRVWGELALFTRPEMKVERVSYDCITPSAARNIFQAIYWKPEIDWVIDRIHVLKPIRFTNLRRNEVGHKIPVGTVRQTMKAGKGNLGMAIEEDRQQRAATLLRDVEYVVEAHFILTSGIDGLEKHSEMFRRRAERGQCFSRPYLGTRECPADFELIEGVIPESDLRGELDLGLMLHDIDYQNGMQPVFFNAVMRDGIIDVPPLLATSVNTLEVAK